MIVEACESPLKPLINEVEVKKRLSDKKINIADEMLRKVSDAEKDFDSSFSGFFKSIETTTENLKDVTSSLDCFIESSVDLQEVLENAKELVYNLNYN